MAKKIRFTAEDLAFYEQAAQDYYDALAKRPVLDSTASAALRELDAALKVAEVRAQQEASARQAAEALAQQEASARETAEAEVAKLRAELDKLKKSK